MEDVLAEVMTLEHAALDFVLTCGGICLEQGLFDCDTLQVEALSKDHIFTDTDEDPVWELEGQINFSGPEESMTCA